MFIRIHKETNFISKWNWFYTEWLPYSKYYSNIKPNIIYIFNIFKE